jgi:hypothetical protein
VRIALGKPKSLKARSNTAKAYIARVFSSASQPDPVQATRTARQDERVTTRLRAS